MSSSELLSLIEKQIITTLLYPVCQCMTQDNKNTSFPPSLPTKCIEQSFEDHRRIRPVEDVEGEELRVVQISFSEGESLTINALFIQT